MTESYAPSTSPTPVTSYAPHQMSDAQPRPALRRTRTDRLLFGVCGGIARYFEVDPTLVRVGFVLVGLVPPLGGTLLLAYAAMAVLVPQEDAESLTGREQVKENLSSLRSEVSGLAETIRARVTGEPAIDSPRPAAPSPSGITAPDQHARAA